MVKLLKPKQLEKFRKKLSARRPKKTVISISYGTCGQARGALKVANAFKEAVKGLEKKISIKVTGCHGFCEAEPNVIIYPEEIFYRNLKPEDAGRIVNSILNGGIINDLIYKEGNNSFIHVSEIPFYKKQMRILSGKNPLINPLNIEDYIALDGYKALTKALHMGPEEIITEVKRSGLRGRGGAGFPTGIKWEVTRMQEGDIKYAICNADEGDPGAYMDRSLLEGNPHSVIEGMIIGAYAIGANEGWIYARNEYPLAVKHLTFAIEQAKELDLLGKNILGSNFNFDIKIAKGAGAFVCGEETALIASIEGKRGVPKQRPPYPAQHGLFGKPTNINNVETWANIPIIIDKGADWFASIGTASSKGTKIFSLVGKVQNSGLVEVPTGTTISEIVFGIGVGAPNGKKVKAVQIGGPSGACIPQQLFHLPIDYESLKGVGAIMGSGGMIVVDENTCMVDIAKYFTNFLQEESCGKCSVCREGTQRMHEILTDITEGRGKEENLGLLSELGKVIKDASMCGLGQTAPNPVMASLRSFRDEYLDHIEKKRCNAGICKEIISSPCQHTCPMDTEAPVYVALIASGRYEDALKIIKKDNPLASVLSRVCHNPCEFKCRAGEGGESIAIRNLKRFVADYGLRNNLQIKTEPAKKTKGIKVAIIGSGPAGLTCGFYLAQKGYGVTIFEKQPVPGGMLAVGIPEYRLPKEILETDINYIKSAGMEIHTNRALGKDFVLNDLFNQDYKAIFIATGAHKSLKLKIPGETAPGVVPGMELLTTLNLGKDIEIGRRAGIIGGGNSAVDAARSILRTGKPKSVTIFYRRTIAEMPAYKEEVEDALEEGIKIEFLTAPKKIITHNGKLKACEFIKMKLGERDESGRRRPIPIEGSEFTVELDTLIVSIGERPDITSLEKEGLEFSRWDTVLADTETFHTTKPGVFAGGDLVTGPNTVVDAAASGKIAAESIDQFLTGKEVKRAYKTTRPSMYIEPLYLSDEELEELLSSKRPERACLSLQERKFNFNEVEQGLTEAQAVKEAKRCLRCELETEDGKRYLEKIKEVSSVEREKT